MDWSPLWISLKVSTLATLFSVLVGLPIAFALARRPFPGRDAVIGLANLPLVLPPTVLGYALLVALGDRSPLSRLWLDVTGHPLKLVFTWYGAVVAACIVSIPLFISQARVSIAAVDRDLIDAARIDGAGGFAIFRRVIAPLSISGLVAGTTLAFARALGDFGATIMVAGDMPGSTQTMSMAIYDAVSVDDVRTIRVFAAITCTLCVLVTVGAAQVMSSRR